MAIRKKIPRGTEDDPRPSWRHVLGTRYYQAVLRAGEKIIWVCNHNHPSPNGYGTTLPLGSTVKWSALDCAEQEKKRRADEKTVARVETASRT